MNYTLAGLGTGGLLYLLYSGRAMAHNAYAGNYLAQQRNFFDPIVKQRIQHTLGYFSGGLAFTGFAVQMLRNSRFAYMNPWVLMFGSIGLMIGTLSVNYQTKPFLKHLLFAGFIGSISLSMVPLINMFAMPVVFDALFATGFTMAGLGLIAYNAPSE